MKIDLGQCPVIENDGKTVTIAIQEKVFLHIHITGLRCSLKRGDAVTLFTEMPINADT